MCNRNRCRYNNSLLTTSVRKLKTNTNPYLFNLLLHFLPLSSDPLGLLSSVDTILELRPLCSFAPHSQCNNDVRDGGRFAITVAAAPVTDDDDAGTVPLDPTAYDELFSRLDRPAGCDVNTCVSTDAVVTDCRDSLHWSCSSDDGDPFEL